MMAPRYLGPKYSMWISTDPALSNYIPAVGKATTDEASNLPGMGGLFNHVNHNLYHYAGNNPVKYVDPDGKKLELIVDKSTQTMTVKMSVTIGNVTFVADETFSVTTHVVANSDASQPNKKANENLNPEKQNPNGSAWTQFPNGEWNITGFKDGPNKNVDGFVDEQLTTDAHQLLLKRDSSGNVVKKNGNDVYVDDWGYNIHFTENSNTAGCIGLKDKIAMKFIILLYKFNEKFDPKSSTIKVIGSEE